MPVSIKEAGAISLNGILVRDIFSSVMWSEEAQVQTKQRDHEEAIDFRLGTEFPGIASVSAQIHPTQATHKPQQQFQLQKPNDSGEYKQLFVRETQLDDALNECAVKFWDDLKSTGAEREAAYRICIDGARALFPDAVARAQIIAKEMDFPQSQVESDIVTFERALNTLKNPPKRNNKVTVYQELKNIYNYVTDEVEKSGFLSQEQAREDREWVNREIRSMG